MNSLNGLYLTAAGMRSQEALLNGTAQNLANASTPGYKTLALSVQGLDPTPIARLDYALGGELTPLGQLPGTPVATPGAVQLAPGPLQATGQPLDVALSTDGSFVVQTPNGLRYTRRGDFHQDGSGRLVNADGYPVLVGGSPVGELGKPVRISETGQVRVDGAVAGHLDVVDLAQAGAPIAAGGGYLLPAPGANPPTVLAPGGYQVRVGYLEQSGVDPMREMVNLMTAVRTYETNQRVLQAQDETLGRAASELARF